MGGGGGGGGGTVAIPYLMLSNLKCNFSEIACHGSGRG